MNEDDKYYNPNNMISRNALINFIIGARSVGKTYGLKKYIISKALKGEGNFIYLRRTKTERESVSNFFGTIQNDPKFKDYAFIQIGRSLKAAKSKNDEGNWEWFEIGRMYGLSEERKIRSDEFPDFKYMLYDEWLPERRTGFLKNEPNKLMMIADTVFRDRDFQIFCLANSSVLFNPYFTVFNITPNVFKEFTVKGDVLVQIIPTTNWLKYRTSTPIGRLIAGTEYEKFSSYNEFTDNDDALVEEKTRYAKNIAVFIMQGDTVGIWYDEINGKVYISDDYNPSVRKKYGFFPDDYSEENINYKEVFNTGVFDKMMRARKNNDIRFTTKSAKAASMEALEKIRII